MTARPRFELRREGGRLLLAGPGISDGTVVFAGSEPDRIDRTRPLPTRRADAALHVDPPAAAPRHYLLVIGADGHEELVAERLLPLEGAENFRDVGGYPSADGRRVRWGAVFRSDSLATLSEADLSTLDALGLRLVCDFRGDAEVEEEPNLLAGRASVRYWRRPLGDSNVQPAEWRRRFESGDFGDIDSGWLTRSYRGMIDRSAPDLAAVFRRLAAADAVPAVLHCTAGKDRTGVAVALLLLLLGVSRDCVIEDYALTAHFTGDRIRAAERYFRERGIDPERV
ncbi:MAG: tyrosine-protein phosphatase [Myxococcota bacterium]